MGRYRVAAAASLGVVSLLGPAFAASAAPDTSAGQVAGRGGGSSGGEFVVSYEGDAAAVAEAVAAAGGTVVDVNESAGLALVSSPKADFIAAATATEAVTGAARNHSVGTARPGQKHRYVEERPSAADRAAASRRGAHRPSTRGGGPTEPLADLQWDMQMMQTDAAHRKATGRGVTVGIIDTGVDASHPDLARNVSTRLSRNFTMDIPAIDGPCEVPTCIDPPTVDDGGHGTHVAGTVAAARNGLGIEGVAPDATIVNVRAGQDSGYFFLYETVAALTYAADAGLDVVNMSFYTDPWLYNCDSADDYLDGAVTPDQLDEQAFTKATVTAALHYAHDKGVSLVGSAGNSNANMALPSRFDDTSPDYPGGTEVERTVTRDCLDLPAEGPHVITVSSVGPSGTKADYSSYGLDAVEVSAPGGWFRDYVGTDRYRTPGNTVLSTYPLSVAIEEGLVDENGEPLDDFSVKSCDARGRCGVYTYLQGTSMAGPHVAGLAALVVEEYGRGTARRGYSLAPDRVTQIIEDSAVDHACPAGGVEIYTDEERPESYNAICEGTTDDNGLYGEGIVNAAAAVGARR